MLSLRESVEWRAREGKLSIPVKDEGLEMPAGARYGRLVDDGEITHGRG